MFKMETTTMLTLYKGRPEEAANRLDKELRCYELLDSLNLEYYRVDHEAAMTMEVCREIEKSLGAEICKNIFLCNRQQTDFYLLLTPGDKRFKTKDLSHQLGVSRLSFAGEEHMAEFLDITPGSVSVLGLMNDSGRRIRLIIDKDVLENENFGCHPCINTSTLRIKTADLLEKVIPALGHEPTYVELPRYDEE